MTYDIILKQGLEKDSLTFKKVKSKSEIEFNPKIDGYLIEAEEKEIRKIVESLKHEKKLIAVLARDNEHNRRMLETCKINYLVFPEGNYIEKKDTLRQRDSGLNHVLAKIAKENNISIVINFSEVLKWNEIERAKILGRIMQNIRICRKVRCKIKIATFAESKEQLRNVYDLKAFAFSLGMSSQQANDAFVFP
ncbi:MAG: RNase P subunit p30 family protein [Nanoarchaeota archaeon]